MGKKTQRAIPTPNIPEPMPPNLAFMFTKISPEQKMYMWNIYTLIFALQCLDVVLYWALLTYSPLSFAASTAIYGFLMVALCVQNVYILHDVIHGATFPPYEWQNYIGASDTGGLFAFLWWCKFPDAGPGGKCDKAFYTKWLP